MLSVKVLGVLFSLLHVYAIPTVKKDEENEKNSMSYQKENFKVSYTDEYKNVAVMDNDVKVSVSTRYGRSPHQTGISELKHENGTVEGHGEGHEKNATGFDRYVLVTYVTDSAGHRATVRKWFLGGSPGMSGLRVKIIDGKLPIPYWEIKSVAASVNNFYTLGAHPKNQEEDDSY